jgi:hypothetical protein
VTQAGSAAHLPRRFITEARWKFAGDISSTERMDLKHGPNNYKDTKP